MRNYTLDIAQREIGNLPLSVGTSLAIELFTDRKDPDNPDRVLAKPNPPEQLWVNLRTLFRNLYNAIEPDLRKKALVEHFTPTLITEMEQIREIVSERSLGRTTAVFYHCSYTDLLQRFPKAVHKPINTELQKMYFALEQATCSDVVEKLGKSFGIKEFTSKIRGDHRETWLMTHIPVDLLSTDSFAKITLLESHTAKLKTKLDWNSKLTSSDKNVNLPFCAFTMQVFGDGGVFFSPMPLKIKREVLEISVKYNWTPATSLDKIRYGIHQIKDHFGREWLLSLAR